VGLLSFHIFLISLKDVIASRFFRTAFWASLAKQSPIKWENLIEKHSPINRGLLTGTARQRKCRREEHAPGNDMIRVIALFRNNSIIYSGRWTLNPDSTDWTEKAKLKLAFCL
jgi:hypothetical protein